MGILDRLGPWNICVPWFCLCSVLLPFPVWMLGLVGRSSLESTGGTLPLFLLLLGPGELPEGVNPSPLSTRSHPVLQASPGPCRQDLADLTQPRTEQCLVLLRRLLGSGPPVGVALLGSPRPVRKLWFPEFLEEAPPWRSGPGIANQAFASPWGWKLGLWYW